MTIYKSKRTPSYIYRKIYEQHYGKIPVDVDGRTYEIHHRDGNDKNNDPSNLQALSIQEHYDLHFNQGDWIACAYIARYRLNFTKEQLSELARKSANERVKLGTNPFQKRSDGTSLATDRVKNGTHNLLKRSDGTSQASDLVKKGTHVCLRKGKDAPRFDSTVYVFYNESEQLVEICSQNELRTKYSYLNKSKGNLSSLVNQKHNVSVVCGWRMIH